MVLIQDKELERYWRQHCDMLTFHKLFNELGSVDERATAIIGGAFLDSILENTLRNFMVDDEKETKRLVSFDGAMGTYSNRTTAAYCLGLICKTVRDDLRVVGRIRNKFAHQLEASFDTEPIREWCFSLKWHEISMMMKAPDGATARDVFEVGVNQLISYLSGMSNLARVERCKARE